MNKATQSITLIALLIVGLVIGYLRSDHQDNNTDTTVTNKEKTLQIQKEKETIQEKAPAQQKDIPNTQDQANDNGTSILNQSQSDLYKTFPSYDQAFVATFTGISSPKPYFTFDNQPQDTINQRFKLQGKTTSDVERVDVIRDGDMTPFTLKKFIPGEQNFEYNMNPEFGNLVEGKNIYLIRSYANKAIYQTIIEVNYDPKSE